MSYVDLKGYKSFYLLLPSGADDENRTVKGPYPIERLAAVMKDVLAQPDKDPDTKA